MNPPRPGESATGTLNEAVPVAGFALNVSPIPRIAPPPFGSSTLGADTNSSFVLDRASTGTGRPSGRTTARSRDAGAGTPVPAGARGALGVDGRSATRTHVSTSTRTMSFTPANDTPTSIAYVFTPEDGLGAGVGGAVSGTKLAALTPPTVIVSSFDQLPRV